MQLLEHYQNQLPNSDFFIPRKCNLSAKGNMNLYGVRGSGKTSLVLDYLAQAEQKQVLYIDMEDPNLTFNDLDTHTLQSHINNNNIQILVLDHYSEEYLISFPNISQLITVTRTPIEDINFIGIELFPLDYEEFLAFESTPTQNQGFNHFLRSGTLPLIARSQKNIQHTMKTFYRASFDLQEQKLLLVLAQHHTKHLTTHQIYTFAKEKFKVSKDWLYRTIKNFANEKLIIFIDDKYHKSGKKMLIFDFAFAKYLTLGQPFIIQFDTMIALTLIRQHSHIQTLSIHGYINEKNELVIPAPFESEESLWIKSQNKFGLYKKYGIKKIIIVTVANTYEYTIEKLHFEALPFNEWSVISDELTLI